MIGLFSLYLQNSLSLSMIALLIMALSPLLSRRYSASSRYYLWLIVFVALALPIRPEISIAMPESFQRYFLKSTSAMVSGSSVIPNVTKAYDWQQYAGLLWVLGAFCFLGWHMFQYLRFMSAVRRWGENINDSTLLELFSSIKEKLGIKNSITVKSCACIKTPMLIGFLHPVVLLPRISISQEELPLILKHELIHYKRWDIWYRVLMMLTLAIHWYNPVIHLMVKSTLSMCEISCDEKVLQGSDAKERMQYGESIISIIRKQSTYRTILSTGFYSGTREIKKRIYAMLDMTSKRTSPVLFAVILLLSLCSTTAFALPPMKVQDASRNSNHIALSVPDPNRTNSEVSAVVEQTPTPVIERSNEVEPTSNSNDLSFKDNEPQLIPSDQTAPKEDESRLITDNESSHEKLKRNTSDSQLLSPEDESKLVIDNESSLKKSKSNEQDSQLIKEKNEPKLVTDNESLLKESQQQLIPGSHRP